MNGDVVFAEFVPYVPEPKYKVVLTKAEALFIQKIRNIKHGHIVAHAVNGRILRMEEMESTIMDRGGVNDAVTIAVEVIEGGV